MKLNLLTAVALLCLATPAFAQVDDGAPGAKTRIRLGPLTIDPTVALTNLGVDTNVFNSADNPQSDFTMTVTPQAAFWLRLGRSRVTAVVKEDLVYYNQFESERAANTSYTGDIRVPLNRITLTVGTDYLDTRDRPGYEIDARSQHTQGDLRGLVEYRMFGKTFAGVTASRSNVAFDHTETYEGSQLWRELNRAVTSAGLAVRHELTPLTSLTFNLDRQQDRFTYEPLRDSDSTRAVVGLKFDPQGVISGAAAAGYRKFNMLAGNVADFSGLVSTVDVSYRALASTRLGVQFLRDLDYSYEIEQPYYVETGVTGSVTQALGGPFDVVGKIGAYQLAYQGTYGAAVAAPNRVDTLHIFGGGIGYRIGKTTRLGFNIDQQNRSSVVAGRSYEGLRFGTAVTHVF